MSVVVFAGPTISRSDIEAIVAADVQPPAARGDLLRAARSRPEAIALIDGRFDGVPAVWHKEVLWAMAQGIHVFGAASMGALRAAELDGYGMEGFGAIYESYRDGRLIADDEVAIAHATAEHDYRALSDPLVNIRATLQRAASQAILSDATAFALLQRARNLPYSERSFPKLMSIAEQSDLPEAEVTAFRFWLPLGRVDQKRTDAVDLLQALASRLRSGLPPKKVNYAFAQTDAWQALWQQTTAKAAVDPGQHGGVALLEELAASDDFESVRNGAMARALALEVARRSAVRVSDRCVREAGDEFRRERGLLSPEQFDTWVEANAVAESDVDAFIVREATIRRVQAEFEPELVPHVVDQLRCNGDYARLWARGESGQEAPVFTQAQRQVTNSTLTDDALWQWYCLQYLRLREVPADLDIFATRRFTTASRLRERALLAFRNNVDSSAQSETGSSANVRR